MQLHLIYTPLPYPEFCFKFGTVHTHYASDQLITYSVNTQYLRTLGASELCILISPEGLICPIRNEIN
jgi:hypothetical protein